MKIKNKIIALMISLIVMPTFAFAQKKTYFGAQYTKNSVDTGVSNISSNLDEKDNGYAIFLGTEITPNLDVELMYNDFGKASLGGVIGNRFTFRGTTYQFTANGNIDVKATSWGIALKPKYQFHPNFNVGATLGAHRWSGETSVNNASTGTLNSSSVNDNDWFYGIGANYVNEDFTLGLNYTVYKIDGGAIPIDEIKSIGLRAAYRF
jgi:hypothetical protein